MARDLAEGRAIPAHDLLIAASAAELGFCVVTCDRRHFDAIPGLEVELWAADRSD